jgi:hypothetical protein
MEPTRWHWEHFAGISAFHHEGKSKAIFFAFARAPIHISQHLFAKMWKSADPP